MYSIEQLFTVQAIIRKFRNTIIGVNDSQKEVDALCEVEIVHAHSLEWDQAAAHAQRRRVQNIEDVDAMDIYDVAQANGIF